MLKVKAWPAHSQYDWVCSRFLILRILAGKSILQKAAVWGRGRLVLTRPQLVIYAAGRQALLNQTLGTSVMDFAPSHFLWQASSPLLQAGDWMYVPTHAGTAILHVLEGIWGRGHDRHARLSTAPVLVHAGILTATKSLTWTAARQADFTWGIQLEFQEAPSPKLLLPWEAKIAPVISTRLHMWCHIYSLKMQSLLFWKLLKPLLLC